MKGTRLHIMSSVGLKMGYAASNRPCTTHSVNVAINVRKLREGGKKSYSTIPQFQKISAPLWRKLQSNRGFSSMQRLTRNIKPYPAAGLLCLIICSIFH